MPKNKKLATTKAKKNVVKSSTKKTSTAVPLARSQKARTVPFGIRLSHREFVSELDINTSYAFDLSVNNATAFPWLSSIAPYFDQYRVWKLRFSIEPSIAATHDGVVCMAFEPNATDTPPSTLAALLQSAYRDSGAVWDGHSITVPATQLARSPGPTRFTRVSTDSDPLLRSLGQILINSSGSALTGFALLFVEYEVELINPQPLAVAPVLPGQATCMLQLPGRESTVTTANGGILTDIQKAIIAGNLPDGVRLVTDVVDSLLNTSTGLLENTPLELEFDQPGKYAINLASFPINDYDTESYYSFPALANWTKGVSLLGLAYRSDPGQILQGVGTAYVKNAEMLVNVVNTVDKVWNELAHSDFSSIPTKARIALGRWCYHDGGYIGWKGSPLSSLASFGNYANNWFGVSRSPRANWENVGRLNDVTPNDLIALSGRSTLEGGFFWKLRRENSATTTTSTSASGITTPFSCR